MSMRKFRLRFRVVGSSRPRLSVQFRSKSPQDKSQGQINMVRVGTVVRTLILCGLALTTLAFAKTNKTSTSVTYPSGFALSHRVSDLPIDEPLFAGEEIHEPGPGPLRFKQDAGPALLEDPVRQKEYGPQG